MPNIELETIANVSYALMLASYIMRDILWLRVLTVVSFCFEIPYFYFQPDPPMGRHSLGRGVHSDQRLLDRSLGL